MNHFMILSGDVSVVSEHLENSLTCSGVYDTLYVSLGGKYNQPFVRFSNPSYLASKQYPTNTSFQMIPAFLRYCHPGTLAEERPRTLVIIVDDFETKESRDTNTAIVRNTLEQCPHIDIILYNKTLHLDGIRPLATMLIRVANTHAISPNRCMFCNFIRFRGCTSIDLSQLEAELPRIFQKELDANSGGNDYSECLYQWFGYQFYVYNLVFSYKKYNMKRHLTILRLLSEFYDSTQLSASNVANLFEVEDTFLPQTKQLLRDFAKTTVDLLSRENPTRSMICSRLYDSVHYRVGEEEALEFDMPTNTLTYLSGVYA